MIRFRNPAFARVLVLGTAIAALGLSGCGRKGGLDPPPSASAAPPQQSEPQRGGLSPIGQGQPADAESQHSVLGERAGIGGDGRPVAPRGERRRIPLDALID